MKQLGPHVNLQFEVKGEFVTFSTFLLVDCKQVLLTYTHLLSYINLDKLKAETYDEAFKKCFLHSKQSYVDPEGKMYTWIVESNYNLSGQWHELRWEEF